MAYSAALHHWGLIWIAAGASTLRDKLTIYRQATTEAIPAAYTDPATNAAAWPPAMRPNTTPATRPVPLP